MLLGRDLDRVTYVGHSTVLVEVEGARLLTDPILGRRVGPLARHGQTPDPAIAEGLDAVFISHLHRDHADLGSLRRIGRGTPLLVPPRSRRFFERQGFESVTELEPGCSTQVGRVKVSAVDADHEGRGRRFAEQATAIGFLIEGRRRIYFAGDTDLFPGMGDLGPGLDLALLPIWGWGPSIGPGHLDPERAARAAALLSPRIAVPIHWGTLYPLGLARLRPSPLRSPGPRFAEQMRRLAPQVQTRVLAPGASLSLA
ncbi:MAG TPA: MBL fold metallo-hydrolase [Solirubrobacterales bacterium]|jgi:L-ascorbate metabolism protein UlaG (beta-lactamase superfamily)|nr:MBL fold metallo-hydrolase [Solirubrobacterales bacterium]